MLRREDDEDRVTATLSEEAEDFLQEKINWRALEVAGPKMLGKVMKKR